MGGGKEAANKDFLEEVALSGGLETALEVFALKDWEDYFQVPSLPSPPTYLLALFFQLIPLPPSLSFSPCSFPDP